MYDFLPNNNFTETFLPKCFSCGVPVKECLSDSSCGYSSAAGNGWACPKCVEGSTIRCSHCNTIMSGSLPEPLDDGSFLCNKCTTKLLEELDEFTNNN